MKNFEAALRTITRWRGRLSGGCAYNSVKTNWEAADESNPSCTYRIDTCYGTVDEHPGHRAALATTKDETQTNKATSRPQLHGIVIAIASGFFMACTSLFVKLSTSLPYFMMLIARSLGIIAFCPPLIVYNYESIVPVSGNEFFYILMHALLGCGTMVATYFSFGYMPLVDAITIVFTSPVWTAILAYFLLKEAWGAFDCVALVLSVAGVTLITRPTFIFHSNTELYTSSTRLRSIAIAAAFGASVVNSLTYICVRKLEKSGPFVVVFYYGVIGLIMGVVIGAIEGGLKYPDCGTHDNCYALLCAVCAFCGQVCLVYALTIEDAATVALCRAMDIPFVFILETVFLHTPFSLYSLSGCGIVLLSNVIIFLKKRYTNINKQ